MVIFILLSGFDLSFAFAPALRAGARVSPNFIAAQRQKTGLMVSNAILSHNQKKQDLEFRFQIESGEFSQEKQFESQLPQVGCISNSVRNALN